MVPNKYITETREYYFLKTIVKKKNFFMLDQARWRNYIKNIPNLGFFCRTIQKKCGVKKLKILDDINILKYIFNKQV